jgi:hypothetical protein
MARKTFYINASDFDFLLDLPDGVSSVAPGGALVPVLLDVSDDLDAAFPDGSRIVYTMDEDLGVIFTGVAPR